MYPAAKNEAADALSQLPYNSSGSQELYDLSGNDLAGTAFPLIFHQLEVEQGKGA